jgi:hypothetical protein
VWGLADKASGETPLWVAELTVFPNSVALLSRFRMQGLSVEQVYRVHAFNEDGQAVYVFEYHWPDYCYNCIYDDMPLRGWWPWPKPSGGRAPRHVGVSEPTEEPREAVEDDSAPPSPVSRREPLQPYQEPVGCAMM